MSASLFPAPERVTCECCTDHNVMCWYDPCCGTCPELERCRARLGPGLGAPRCTLAVSEHDDPRSTNPADHEWAPAKSMPKHRKDVPVDACSWGGHAPCKACASGQVRGTHCAELEVAR